MKSPAPIPVLGAAGFLGQLVSYGSYDEPASVCGLNSLSSPAVPVASDPMGCDALAYASCDSSDECTAAVGWPADEDDSDGCEKTCSDGTLYPAAVGCDGIRDCPGGEDEVPANCDR